MLPASRSRPSRIYVWLVPSEEVLEQPGSWRIRKWDTEPFPESNYALSESGQRDAERLDHLAEITNLATLQESGHMLTGEQARQIAKTAKALSVGYELHRRTNDTPQAFRFAVDDAMRGK